MKDFDRKRLEAVMARRVFLKGAGSLGAVALPISWARASCLVKQPAMVSR
jgi:hypothetical protein